MSLDAVGNAGRRRENVLVFGRLQHAPLDAIEACLPTIRADDAKTVKKRSVRNEGLCVLLNAENNLVFDGHQVERIDTSNLPSGEGVYDRERLTVRHIDAEPVAVGAPNAVGIAALVACVQG